MIRLLPLAAACLVAACTAQVEVVDLRSVPQVTRDALVQVQVIPLGMHVPPGVGSIGPVTGLGCAATPSLAANEAVQQVRVKALEMHASAVGEVLITPGGFSVQCLGGYSASASGIALAARGVPSSY